MKKYNNNNNLLLGITLFFVSISPLYAVDAGAFSIQFSDNSSQLSGEIKNLESTLEKLNNQSNLNINISMGQDQLKIIFNNNQAPVIYNNGVNISQFINPPKNIDFKVENEAKKGLSEVVEEILHKYLLDKQLKQEPNIIHGSPSSGIQKLVNSDFDIAMNFSQNTKTLSLDGALIGRFQPPLPVNSIHIPKELPKDFDRDMPKEISHSNPSFNSNTPVAMMPKEMKEQDEIVMGNSNVGFQGLPKDKDDFFKDVNSSGGNFPKDADRMVPPPVSMIGDKNTPKMPDGDNDKIFYKSNGDFGGVKIARSPDGKDKSPNDHDSDDFHRGDAPPSSSMPPDRKDNPPPASNNPNGDQKQRQGMDTKTKTTKDKKDKDDDKKTDSESSEKKPDLRSLEVRFGTLKSPGQKSNSTTLPFSLRRDLGNGKEIIFKVPITTVVTNGVKSQSVGTGISYKYPMNDNWSLLFSGNIGFINANQTETSARNWLTSVSSTYTISRDDKEYYFTNMIGMSRTDNIKVSGIGYNGTLNNVILRNGIIMAKPIQFFNNLLTVEYSIVDTRYFGTETTMPNFQELGISWGTKRHKETKDTLRFGITYTHAKSAMGWTFTTGYSF